MYYSRTYIVRQKYSARLLKEKCKLLFLQLFFFRE